MHRLVKQAVAQTFHDLVGVTGTIVTKLDGTARGGGALSAVSVTGAPIVFVGEGERVEDLEKFESDGSFPDYLNG